MLARDSLKILAQRCPLYPAPLESCPLRQLRALAPDKRSACIDALSENDVEALVRGHVLCACRGQGCHTQLPDPPLKADDDGH